MFATIESLLSRNVIEVFGQRDAALRRAAIANLYTQDCVFADDHNRVVGHTALDDAVAALQSRFPGFAFVERRAAQAVQGAGRLAWGFGPPGEAPRVTGVDVIVVEGDRIAALYTFLDPR